MIFQLFVIPLHLIRTTTTVFLTEMKSSKPVRLRLTGFGSRGSSRTIHAVHNLGFGLVYIQVSSPEPTELLLSMSSIPTLVMSGSKVFGGGGGNFQLWIVTVIVGGILISKDVFFILWSQRQLRTKFRAVATGSNNRVWVAKASPVQSANLPPVIPAQP